MYSNLCHSHNFYESVQIFTKQTSYFERQRKIALIPNDFTGCHLHVLLCIYLYIYLQIIKHFVNSKCVSEQKMFIDD